PAARLRNRRRGCCIVNRRSLLRGATRRRGVAAVRSEVSMMTLPEWLCGRRLAAPCTHHESLDRDAPSPPMERTVPRPSALATAHGRSWPSLCENSQLDLSFFLLWQFVAAPLSC